MAKVNPRLIDLIIDDDNRADEVSKFVIGSAASDSDFVSFAAARGGGSRDYVASLTVAQDHATDTLWDLIWTGAGSEVEGVYAPYGNAVASPTQPHYEFTAIVSEPDGDFLGGEATTSTSAVAIVELEWALKGRPVKKTSA